MTQTVEVTAAHLRSARIELSPKVGTTIYSIDQHMVDQLGQGDNTPFNEVLLRLPGVSQDSKGSGSLHVRDDHANVQVRRSCRQYQQRENCDRKACQRHTLVMPEP